MRRVVPKAFPSEFLMGSPRDLGGMIRAARTQTGLSLAEAAIANGISKQTMQRLETDPSTVSLGVALQVSRMLGVSFFAVPSATRTIVQKTLRSVLDDSVNEGAGRAS